MLKKNLFRWTFPITVPLILSGCIDLQKDIQTATGYVAKSLCSSMYVSGKSYKQTRKEDIADFPYVIATHNASSKVVTATFMGTVRHAVYREGLGCTQAIGLSVNELRDQLLEPLPVPEPPESNAFWPEGIQAAPALEYVDIESIENSIDTHFKINDQYRINKTRAVVVVHNGRIISERYSEDVTKDTPQLSNSMTKMLTGTLVGMLQDEGRLQTSQLAAVDQWQVPGDPRGTITIENLLELRSGMKWNEDGSTSGATDLSYMLFGIAEGAEYAANKELVNAPGAHFQYSSGTSRILSSIVKDAIGGSQYDYFSYVREQLFIPLGMRNTVIEADASGTFQGGTRAFATPRDWAKFGLLFQQGGQWQGQQLISQEWIDYATTPISSWTRDEGTIYHGRHWWLNRSPELDDAGNSVLTFPKIPEDVFYARGAGDQYVVIFPSNNLVVVRMGYSPDGGALDQMGEMLGEIYEAVIED